LIVFAGATTKIGTPNSGSVPLQADFTGDGKDDPAVFEPSTGTWRYISSNTGQEVLKVYGQSPGDIPVPRDYDADGKTDFAIFRPSNATWFILNSSGGSRTQPYGLKTDTPVSEPLQYLIGADKAQKSVSAPTLAARAVDTRKTAVLAPTVSSAFVVIPDSNCRDRALAAALEALGPIRLRRRFLV
jgi:hypothetical protein